MARGKTATEGFGARILRLAGKRKLTEVAESAGLPYRLVWRWSQRGDRPPGMDDRIVKLERALGGPLLDEHEREGADVNRIGESPAPYNDREPKRVVQPYDFKKRALIQLGLARHELSAILAAIDEGVELDPETLADHLEKADAFSAKAQRYLMGKIRVNDRGEPV